MRPRAGLDKMLSLVFYNSLILFRATLVTETRARENRGRKVVKCPAGEAPSSSNIYTRRRYRALTRDCACTHSAVRTRGQINNDPRDFGAKALSSRERVLLNLLLPAAPHWAKLCSTVVVTTLNQWPHHLKMPREIYSRDGSRREASLVMKNRRKRCNSGRFLQRTISQGAGLSLNCHRAIDPTT